MTSIFSFQSAPWKRDIAMMASSIHGLGFLSAISFQTIQKSKRNMPNDPLLQLLCGNLADAQRIGMIDSADPAVAAFDSSLASTWDASSSNPLEEFERHMSLAQARLSSAYRPRQAFRGKTLSVVHVKPLKNFIRWAREIDGMPNRYDFEKQAKENATSTYNVVRASEACLRMTQELGASSHRSGRGKLIRAELLQPNDRSFWIGRRTSPSLPNDADFWRDRLGLIHLQADSSSLIGDMLVRVELGVELSKTILLPDRWRQQISAEGSGCWLIRPTLVHFGNQRFVQAHMHDSPSRVYQKHGRTRDLSSPVFSSGERELLVLYGTDAKFRFRGVELLSGIPSEDTARDNSDKNFIAQIKMERGW